MKFILVLTFLKLVARNLPSFSIVFLVMNSLAITETCKSKVFITQNLAKTAFNSRNLSSQLHLSPNEPKNLLLSLDLDLPRSRNFKPSKNEILIR
jgi:hypothetical protein